MSTVQVARIARTRYYVEHRGEFLSQLEKEIAAFVRKCQRLKRKPCVRLNGTSDIMWEQTGILQKFPKVQFYDYTKIFARVTPEWKLPENYYLTFSMTESNLVKALDALAYGKNIAVVFGGKFPKSFLGYPVIDGTKHDLRFLDPKGVVVALKPLGKARKDTSGFVRNINQGDSNGKSDQRTACPLRETE